MSNENIELNKYKLKEDINLYNLFKDFALDIKSIKNSIRNLEIKYQVLLKALFNDNNLSEQYIENSNNDEFKNQLFSYNSKAKNIDLYKSLDKSKSLTNDSIDMLNLELKEVLKYTNYNNTLTKDTCLENINAINNNTKRVEVVNKSDEKLDNNSITKSCISNSNIIQDKKEIKSFKSLEIMLDYSKNKNNNYSYYNDNELSSYKENEVNSFNINNNIYVKNQTPYEKFIEIIKLNGINMLDINNHKLNKLSKQ